MKIAVTGCNGSVGRRVVIRALDEGHSVVGIDASPLAITIDDIQVRRVAEHEAFSFVQHDVRQFDGIMDLLKGCDAVVHLAAHRNPTDYMVKTHNEWVTSSTAHSSAILDLEQQCNHVLERPPRCRRGMFMFCPALSLAYAQVVSRSASRASPKPPPSISSGACSARTAPSRTSFLSTSPTRASLTSRTGCPNCSSSL